MFKTSFFKKENLTNLKFLFYHKVPMDCVMHEKISQVSKGVRRMPWPYQPKKDAISCGEVQVTFDPQVSEWGNPAAVVLSSSMRKGTR